MRPTSNPLHSWELKMIKTFKNNIKTTEKTDGEQTARPRVGGNPSDANLAESTNVDTIEERPVDRSSAVRNVGGTPAPKSVSTSDNLVLSNKHVVTGAKPHVPPSKRKFNDRRQALRIIKRNGDVNQETLTAKQRDSLKWARNVIENQDITAASTSEQAAKRLRSPDEHPQPKRAKVISWNSGHRSFSEVVKDDLVMAVIDKGEEDGIIPKDKWKYVVDALSSTYVHIRKEMPGPPPRCRDAGWFQGRAKLVAFGDQRSVDYYRAALKKVGELWPGAALDVVRREDLPSRPRAHAWIPANPPDAETIEFILKDSNPELPTHNWKIGRLEEADGVRRHAMFILNNESLPLLKQSGGVVSFAFGQITLKIYKRDQEYDVVSTANEIVRQCEGEASREQEQEHEDMVTMPITSGKVQEDVDSLKPIADPGEGCLQSDTNLAKQMGEVHDTDAGNDADEDAFSVSDDEQDVTLVERPFNVQVSSDQPSS